jgi:hypothetical protein
MGDYSGQPCAEEGVNAVVGEARAELSRRDARYHLIQVSMIDTWASSNSGAMVLTENILYTQEAFDLYRERLAQDGVLSISRWYHPETYWRARSPHRNGRGQPAARRDRRARVTVPPSILPVSNILSAPDVLVRRLRANDTCGI